MITVLTGGTGGAKFVWGLAQIVLADQLTVIVNTGDDLTWWGLHVSPDIDSVLYALAGKLSPERGWGYAGDTFRCLERMRALGSDGWFQLGDLDLATHLRRTELLHRGLMLSEVTNELCRGMGVQQRVLPMSDDQIETLIQTANGDLAFQEYFVRDRCEPKPLGVRFRGADRSSTAPGILEAITRSEFIFIAPSNPVTSIGPILSVPGVRDTLRNTTARIAAVSPIVGGEAVSGPAAKLMRVKGWPISPAGIAEAYKDFAHLIIADSRDESERAAIEKLGKQATFTNTIMHSDDDKTALAQFALQSVSQLKEAVR
jgi:LPPG:FO 2-phospho-L-lactate transferase